MGDERCGDKTAISDTQNTLSHPYRIAFSSGDRIHPRGILNFHYPAKKATNLFTLNLVMANTINAHSLIELEYYFLSLMDIKKSRFKSLMVQDYSIVKLCEVICCEGSMFK